MHKANSKLNCFIGLIFVLIGLGVIFVGKPILGMLTLLVGMLSMPQSRSHLHRYSNHLKRWLGIGIPMLLLITSAGCGSQADSKSASNAAAESSSSVVSSATSSDVSSEHSMTVHFIDVGQADCILIQTPSASMLVDAGKNEDGDNVVTYLQQQGISRLDYVIGTHPHEDHIGGLDNVIRSFEIGEVILPGKTHTSKTYMDVLQAVQDKGLQITQAVAGQEFGLGDASFTVLSPKEGVDYGDNLNNWSVGIKLINGNNSFVMTGDAEGTTENDILSTGIDLKADVWKAGHHGSITSNTDAILQAVNPQYTVISCGVNNQYGHPNLEILQRFAAQNIQIFRTDEQGTIVATSDGNQITWNAGPSTTMAAGDIQTDQTNEDSEPVNQEEVGLTEQQPPADTPVEEEIQETDSDASQVMVHITETGSKYHSGGCRHLSNSDTEVTLSEAREKGLEPCSQCNPPQ